MKINENWRATSVCQAVQDLKRKELRGAEAYFSGCRGVLHSKY